MPDNGETTDAGEGLTDEEMVDRLAEAIEDLWGEVRGLLDLGRVEQVAAQSPSEERYADVFKREADGATTDTEAAKAGGDELSGE